MVFLLLDVSRTTVRADCMTCQLDLVWGYAQNSMARRRGNARMARLPPHVPAPQRSGHSRPRARRRVVRPRLRRAVESVRRTRPARPADRPGGAHAVVAESPVAPHQPDGAARAGAPRGV